MPKHADDDDWQNEMAALRAEERYASNVRVCGMCAGDLVLVEKYAAVMYGNPEPACELWRCACGHEEEG